jgi:hypothetical protein
MQQNVHVDNLIANLEKRDKTDSQILFEGHFKNPQIPFISVDLSDPSSDKSQGTLRVQAMHDSGCAKTTIQTDVFKSIPNADKIQINKMPNVFVQLCSGEKSKILGHAALKFIFQGENGNVVLFIHNILITDFVQHAFLVGRDFTGSQAKLMETNLHLYLSDNPKSAYDSQEDLQSENVVDVPIIFQFTQKLQIANKLDILILPQTLASIPCALLDTVDLLLLIKQKNENVFFEVKTISKLNIRSLKALLSFTDVNQMNIPVFNSSLEEIFIQANSQFATIEICEESFEVFHMNFSLNQTFSIQSNNLEQIEKDSYLDEDEKEQAFLEYLRTGAYTKSMSQVIKDTPSVTEMKLQKTNPWTDQELEQQFDLDHLPLKSRKQTIKTFKKHIDIFSRHEMDIGCATDVEMDIEIDNSKPKIQKYYPLPVNVRQGVRKILDQILEYGVLRECPEPSNFVGYLLVTKKHNGDICILLDGRLLNNATIRKATVLVSPIEDFAHAAQKAYISAIDILNAFFQIPIKFEQQCYTAFYSDAHGKCYCFTPALPGTQKFPPLLKTFDGHNVRIFRAFKTCNLLCR